MVSRLQTAKSWSGFPFLSTASLTYWLRRSPREWKIPGSNPTRDGIFPRSSHTRDFKIGTPVATLPGAGVIGSVLGLVGLDEMESWICNFYLSVAAREIV